MIGFLAGLGLAKTGFSFGWAFTIISGVVMCVALPKKNLITLVLVGIFGGMLGLMRGHTAWQGLHAYDDYYRKKIVVQGKALSDSTYGKFSQIEFELGSIKIIDGNAQKPMIGKLLINGFGAPMVYRGDIVQVEGKLLTIRGGRQGVIGFANMRVVGHNLPWYETARLRFMSGLESSLPEPIASFGLGILIGQKTGIPQATSDQLSRVGLTHLIAVSGYNLTILIQAARRLGGKRSKYQSTILSILLIGLFLLFSGLSASIVRAAIVSLLSLGAWYYGRAFRPTVLLLLSAVFTAGFYPVYLWSDIGWWLSFLAFFGVIVVGPMLTARVYKDKKPNAIVALLIESFSAQLMTIPIIMFIFGNVSLISLAANAMVVPLVPLAMLLTLVAGLGGMFMSSLAGWFAWPGRLLLTYMLDVIGLFSRVPKMYLHILIDASTMLYMYGLVLGILGLWWHKVAPHYAKITEINSQI